MCNLHSKSSMEEKSLGVIPMMLPSCRPAGCFIGEDVLAAAQTCLPVAATGSVFRPLPSLPLSPSLEQITELQMSGGVAGRPCPGAAVQSSSLAVLPPAVDGNPRRRQECARAWSRPCRPRCVDRSVQLGLIPAVFVPFQSLLPCAVQ